MYVCVCYRVDWLEILLLIMFTETKTTGVFNC